jgi:hypothetical protein
MKLRLTILLVVIAAAGGAYLGWERPYQDVYTEPVPPTPVAELAETVRPVPQSASQSEPDGCTIITHYLPSDDGTVAEVYSCEPNGYQKKHPYESYSNEALASLAYSEAKAAEILSLRLRIDDEETAMSLAIRASALSGGDTYPLLMFSQSYPHPSAINDVPIKKTYRVKYVLSAVALMLGDDSLAPMSWEASIREFSDDPDEELALLDERAWQIVDEMRQIQLDVTGEATIGG